ncbi:EamA family transporter [Microcella sp.]|uniref:EamA family transporter n=1 Tax=Microcella sp. TaxID=1913979 RepID=UPI00299F6AA2|nr:EamA family transporter [Microcella sp.]MDX2025897.1 EamA family transporter [Microcella sp.]
MPVRAPAVNPVLFAVVAIVSVQFGNATAGSLFTAVGPLGAAALRLGFAAAILLAVIRPRVRGWDRRTWIGVGMLGLGLAGMNVLIYLAIDSIPIGVAVTIELLGPLAVAVAGTRRWRDLAWVVLAGIGVALLGVDLDGSGGLAVVGIAAAAGAAAFWALYIVASARLGPRARGVDALAMAMLVAAIIVVPLGAAPATQAVILNPLLLLAFAGIAVVTSALPYALEFLALKAMPTRVFGVLSSLGPAVAALAGFVVLGQALDALQLVAIAAVVAACIGAVSSSQRPPRNDSAAVNQEASGDHPDA